MYHIFVDLEMQNVDRKQKNKCKGCRTEVIEFGAVKLDDQLREVDSFKCYVKPDYSKHIRPMYTQLTGITDSMVQGAKNFVAAFPDFLEWCLQDGEDIRCYEWSNSDLHQLLKESSHKGVFVRPEEEKVLADWIDVQLLYGTSVETNTQVALETAVWTFGESFSGRVHDALCDARNTAMVYRLLQDKKSLEVAKKMLHHGTLEESISFTLGDIFDFSKLQLTAV